MKRRLTKFVVFVLLGAIVNVAVAWTIAVEFEADEWFDYRVGMITGKSGSFEFSIRPVELSGSRLYITYAVSWSNESVNIVNAAFSSAGLPSWVRAKPVMFLVAQMYEAHGWPCVALSSSLHYAGTPELFVIDRGVITGQPLRHQPDVGMVPRALPYGFIWPGFVVNTVFYAAIVWMLWSSPFVVRRVIRRKRGRCIKCGYDLRHVKHVACPECGAEARAA